MYSKSCKYGLRAVLYLAQHTNESHKIGVKDLAGKIKVPHHFLAKILQDLSRKKVISSIKGPNGGFFLTKDNKQENLLSIVELIDGSSWYDDCTFGLQECSNEHPCPIHHIVQPLKLQLYEDLRTQTIQQFVDKLIAGDVHIGRF